MRKRLAVAVLSSAIVIGFSIWFVNKYFLLETQSLMARFWQPPTAGQVEDKALRRIAGWFSLDCGHVRYRANPGRSIACAGDALRTGHRFRVSFDYVGIDSLGVIGLAANSKHEVYEVVTDELGRGHLGYVATTGTVRTTNISRRDKLPVEETSLPANRYLTCHPSTLVAD